MKLVDSHSHLFLEDFQSDLPQVMMRAREAGVTHIFMPNIDSTTIEPMLKFGVQGVLFSDDRAASHFRGCRL